jgi:DNA-binding transcriptional regulator YiaG
MGNVLHVSSCGRNSPKRGDEGLTQEELNQILTRLELRHTDLALLAKVTPRSVHNWTSGKWPVPRPIAILLRAIDKKFITEAWLVKQIKTT